MVEVAFKGEDRTDGASANDRQVGGSHYAGGVQHWDMIELYGVGYLEGCATKYIQRWRLKNGVQDLRKALHYIQKLRELHNAGRRVPRGIVPIDQVEVFCAEHRLLPDERQAITYLLRWEHGNHLQRAENAVEALLQSADQQQ